MQKCAGYFSAKIFGRNLLLHPISPQEACAFRRSGPTISAHRLFFSLDLFLNFVLKTLSMCLLQIKVTVISKTSSGDIRDVGGLKVVNDEGYSGLVSCLIVKTVGNFAVFFKVKVFSTLIIYPSC